MDRKLVGWARAVKARRIRSGRPRPPVLWLFTDRDRLADPLAAAARLPAGLAGVVLRHDGDPARAQLARDLARLCRSRRLALAVAGDWRLAVLVGAGLHLRDGRRPAGAPRWLAALTSSAHGPADLLRARRAGAALAFLSPALATASHPGAAGFGPVRWSAAARRGGGAGALGGVSGQSIRRFSPTSCLAAAAITALS
jgi:thiamine-phosphate pyrophosphorylase